MSMGMALDLDENSDVVDPREYKRMIGSLQFLIVTLLDIQLVMGL
jgi:hypothetical protein